MTRFKWFWTLWAVMFLAGEGAAQYHPLIARRHASSNSMEDVPPPGMTSLTFVFDRTGSMNDDLVQVRHGAKGIFETVMKQRKKLIYNYVLVLFHDPDVDPPFISTDPDVFQQELASVTVQGGGDCPEMTLSGIKKALEVSLPGSYIYVFTDARAKDYHLEERVLNLIQERQSSVVFVMTGDCGNQTSPGYRVFERIAAASFGQVFHLEKSHVNTVLEYVRQAVQQRKIHLLYEVREHGNAHISPIAVDGAMTELTISLSGQRDDSDYLNISLIDPEGDAVDRSRYEHQEGTIDLRNVKLIRVSNPEPGMWQVRTTAKSMHTLRVFGHSGVDFKFGFSTRVVGSIDLAHPRPIANQLTYLMINMTGLEPPGMLHQVTLLDYHGRTLYKNETTIHPGNPYLYYVGPFMPPKGFFFIRIQGEDDTNYEFIRISPTAISTVDATGPRAYMAERTTATAYQPVNLSCSIESVAPYTVYWKHGNTQIGGPLFYKHTDTSVWTIDVVSPHNRGYYMCEVVSENGNFTARTYLDTKEPPPHIIQPRNESVTVGQAAFLHCQTQSIEQASIVWLRKGFVVGNSGKVYQSPNGTLRILDASHVDSGQYLCRATTSGGSAEARVFLQVYDKPQVVVDPKELFVVPHSDLTLRCTVRGIPLPVAEWLFKGVKIENDDHHYVTYDNELIIRNIGQASVGTYECRASNPAGIAADYTTVKFAEKPIIHVTQNRHMVSRGSSVFLDCRVITANPAPTIKWFKDGRPVWPNQNIVIEGGRLSIQHSLDSDAGVFTCKAENMAGEDSKSVTVTIGHSPSIVPSPEQLSVNIEQSVTLQCRVVGTPKPMITWLKDQKAIDVTSPRFTVLPDDSLVIHNVQVEDQGYYTCKADNEFGQQQRNTLVVVTGLVSPILAQAPKDAHLIEGQDLRLGCIVLMGTPKPQVQWLKDGRPLEESANELLEPDGSLILKGGTEDQQGHYTCVAISPAGNATLSIDVQLIMRPVVVDEYAPREVKVRSGDQLDLKCPISSTSATRISWEENGEPITGNSNSHSILPDNSLRIHKTDQIHAGVYTCKATNEAGEVAYNVNVEIQTAPVITSGRSSYELILGDTVNLDCDVESDPPADKTWYFNDVELEAPNIDEYGSLVLESVDENNRGTYKCVAKNDIGQDERSILVTVHIAPQIDKSKLIRSKSAKVNETVVLECPARAFPPPERNWTYEDSKLDKSALDPSVMKISNDGSLILYKVQLSHAGNYKCQVSNLAGNDNITYSLQVQSPAKILTQLPVKTKVIAGIPYTLNCKVSGTPEPSLVWEKDGVVISGDASNYLVTHSGALRIKSPSAGEAGVYKCTARNIAGEESVETIVEVKSPPVVKQNQKSKYQLLEDQPGFIHCYVDAIPQPKIEWYMDNKPVSSNEDIIVLPNGTLYLTKVNKQTSGLFSCVAINEAGRTDALITVDVLEKPTIKQDTVTEEQFVINDQPLVLHCPVTSNPVPQIQWLAHGTAVNRSSPHYVVSDDGRRLSILHTNVKDSGRFECIASNAAGEVRKDFAIEVMIPPQLDESTQKRKITVIQGNRVEIHCPVSGHPKPNITWLATLGSNSNKQGLQEDNKDALIIEKVGLSNSGPYVCVASNKAGSVDVTVDLIVLAPPKIVKANPPKVVIGKPFTLNCDIENEDGTTAFKWLFNGRESLPSNAQIPLNGRRLIIPRATEENDGIYTCVAINQVDEDTQDFSVEVNVPPTLIDKTPYDDTITIVEGQKQVLRCDVRGNPPPQIQWFRDDHLIPGSENRTSIEVEAFDETVDKNHYSCVIKNDAGLATKDFFVQSIFAPKMAQLSEEQRAVDAYEGNTATFECPVSSLRLEDLEINWLQKGRPISMDSKRYALSLDRTRLTILGIHLGDEGEYTCVIANKAGKVASQFELNVLVPPNILGTNFEAMEFVEDKSLHLECIYNGFPTPKVVWTKDGGKLPAEAKVMTESRFLHIEKVRPSHAGVYACNVENDAGKVVKTHNITIIRKPALLLGQHSLQDHSVAQSKSTVLECAIEHALGTEFIWLKDGALLKPEAEQKFKFMENGRKLQLTDVEVEDQGLYTCLVRNKAGEEKQEFQLDVKTKPEILSPHRDFTIVENGSLTMVCESNAKPKPTVSWFKNGAKLAPNPKISIKAEGEQLKLSKLDVSDAGHYICRAENELGTAETSFGVTIIQKPALLDVKTDKIDAPLGDSISLNCPIKDPSFIGNITWLYDLKPIDPTATKFTVLHNGRKLIVHDANLQDQGTYTCVVKNLAGENRADYTLDIMVPPSIEMLERDRRRTVVENGTLVLECAANGNPEPIIRWYRDGQKLDHSNVALVIPGARFAGTSLRLENIKADTGGGRYTCEAQNAAGIVDEDISVEVMTKPRIQRLNQPADLDGEIGGRVEIHCPVQGTPAPYVTWLRDGTPLNAAPHSNQIYVSHNQQRLNFVSLQREHAATYTCVAKNAAGNDTRDFRLRFLEEPRIDESNVPAEHVFTINSTIAVQCPADGRPDPTIAWLRDGVPLGVADAIGAKGQDERVVLLNGGKELRIDKAKLSDAGRYTCVATNIAGIADMDTFVKILDIPRFDGKPTSATQNVASLLNKPAVLECKVKNWDDSMEIEWRKDGRTIGGAKGVVEGIDEEYIQITDHGRKLHILSAQKSDAVQWTCIVKNDAGSVQQNFRLDILVKPTIDEKNSSPPLIAALQRDRIEIHCAVTAIPKARIVWRKNGQVLEDNGQFHDQNRTLVIADAQRSDEGRYSCEAENNVGRSAKTFMLQLSAPPVLDANDAQTHVQKGQAVVLNCEPKSGNGPFVTEWYRNKELLQEGAIGDIVIDNTNLVINNAQQEHAGDYYCVVGNSAGQDRKNFKVTVLQRPKFTDLSTITPALIFNHSLILDCKVEGLPPPFVTWLKKWDKCGINLWEKLRTINRVCIGEKSHMMRLPESFSGIGGQNPPALGGNEWKVDENGL
ncbi:unnamed protein product [Bursaphelenchus xylophilus]|uniref:(pine wood nematode) hypothetical protein n=1 Tax=Bursaphelenchus xylophilus TaxID=6326 RepID=A0A1I7RWJ4_BURXY|nr:unnamed protein product [Bursaphelenchus xylophilus]CAG9128424.1 unnamed protein product [Bursaphelenchus xylophilus]